jgi:hypothetical protein
MRFITTCCNHFQLLTTFLEEDSNSADDFCRPRCVFHDPRGGRASLVEIWDVGRKPAGATIGVGDSSSNRLIHFVC